MNAEEATAQAGDLLRRASILCLGLADSSGVGNPSALREIEVRRAKLGSGNWMDEDFKIIAELIRSLIAMVGADLEGLARLCVPDSEFYMHPLMSIIRSEAEATGLIIWLLEPLVDVNTQQRATPSEEEFVAFATQVLARAQLVWIDGLQYRLRRSSKVDPQSSAATTFNLQALASRLLSSHPSQVVAPKKPKGPWTVYGEQMPTLTDRVVGATEFAYGVAFRGSGMNPYPIFSGWAHSNPETLLARAPTSGRPALSQLAQALPQEAHRLMSLALRMAAVSMDFTTLAIGQEASQVKEWERDEEAYVLADVT